MKSFSFEEFLIGIFSSNRVLFWGDGLLGSDWLAKREIGVKGEWRAMLRRPRRKGSVYPHQYEEYGEERSNY